MRKDIKFINLSYIFFYKVKIEGSAFFKRWGLDSDLQGNQTIISPIFNILREFQHKWAKNERAGGAGAPPEAVLGRQDFLPQVRGNHPHRLR